MKFSEFRHHAPRSPAHVYVFVCEEDYLVRESQAVWPGIFGGDWAFEKLEPRELDALGESALMAAALSPPLFGPSRALMVTQAGKLSKKKLAELEAVAALERSSLKVILVAERGALPKGVKLPVIEIDPLRPADVVRWLEERHGIPGEAARYLVDTLGAELNLLDQEARKLQAYVRDERLLEVADVDRLTLRSERFGPFELDDALLARDYPKAFRIASAMIEEGVEPILILYKLTRVWRQLFIGKAMEGKPAADLVRAAGAPAWKTREFLAACHRFSWEALVGGFRHLLLADRAFKTSSPNAEIYLGGLLWKLMR